jgi:hypothetical protein
METKVYPVIVEKGETFKEIEEQWLCLDKLYKFLPGFTTTGIADGLKKTIEWYRKCFY